MQKKLITVLFSTVAGVTMLAGCSSSDKGTSNPDNSAAPALNISTAPVTLTMMTQNTLSETDFDIMFVQPLKKKYPYITIQMTPNNDINKLVTAGEIPDLITTHNGNLGVFADKQLLMDLTPLAKKHNFDLKRFPQIVLDALAAMGPGTVNGIPYGLNFSALYYNKDLFDTFGVAYPKDGMTWDETIDLGKKLTRNLNGTAIRGIDPYALTRFQRIMGNSFYDPKTNKSTLDTPEWKTIFELVKRIITIPGNEWTDSEVKAGASESPNFHSKRIVAMYGGNNLTPALELPTKQGLNWDVAQYPSLPVRANIYNDIDAHLTFITSTSKHPDQAMQVLIALASDDTQMELVRKTARKSPLADTKFEAVFAADMDFAKDKNHKGVFKSKLSSSPL